MNARTTALSIIVIMCAALLTACGRPNTYVLFAGNAKTEKAMENTITLRMPLESQPDGAMIFCEAGAAREMAMRLDARRVKVRETDGEERTLETPHDGIPIGLVTFWPSGKAQHCGIAPPSPAGTGAYFLWGEFTLFLTKVSPGLISYRVGLSDDVLRLPDPLTQEARVQLNKNAVPWEIISLLP